MKKLLMWGGGIFLGLFILGSIMLALESDETKAARAAEEAAAIAAKEQEKAAKEQEKVNKAVAKAQADLEREAAVYGSFECERLVTQRLVSPGSAKFQGILNVKVNLAPAKTADDILHRQATLRGWVDSQNGFGAMLRSQWVCIVEREKPENWVVVDLAVL